MIACCMASIRLPNKIKDFRNNPYYTVRLIFTDKIRGLEKSWFTRLITKIL